MSSRHLVDPELLPALETFQSFEMTRELLGPIRERHKQMLAALPVPPQDPSIVFEERKVPGLRGPDVGVLIYRPREAGDALPAILHIHGGGYVVGTASMMDAALRVWAAKLGCVVVSVDYRLAPETPHPGPVEDCYAALKWLHDNADALSVDRGRIAVAGESAGGGLAAGLALLARDRGEVPLAFQLLIMPMIDDRTCIRDEPHPYTGEFVWTRSSNRFGWTALLGQEPGGPDVPPYAAAARVENLSGLPPAFISVGALDLFLDENVDYALRLTRAGVPAELHVYPGAYHGFQAAVTSRVVLDADRDALAALRRALHPAV
jgi:acetyl esterase/lipase